jgi:hypothetical protein
VWVCVCVCARARAIAARAGACAGRAREAPVRTYGGRAVPRRSKSGWRRSSRRESSPLLEPHALPFPVPLARRDP